MIRADKSVASLVNHRKIIAMKGMRYLLLFGAFLSVFSCAQKEKERVAVPPRSSESPLPWNRGQAGEGNGQFGGMLQRR